MYRKNVNRDSQMSETRTIHKIEIPTCIDKYSIEISLQIKIIRIYIYPDLEI